MHYYPFGLQMAGIGKQGQPEHRWLFQGQEQINDFGLNWSSFKWRNADVQTGRFFNIDPLAEDYYYNSTYAFSENKVTSHVELEGLEAEPWLNKFIRTLIPQAVENPNGAAAVAIGTTVGMSKSVSKTAEGVAGMVSDPLGTLEGIANLQTIQGQIDMAVGVGNYVAERADKLQNGSTMEQSEVVGEAIGDIAQMAFGTKGLGRLKRLIIPLERVHLNLNG
ncbi:MAG: hypothetical protein AAF734_00075 [Bacteroidota bacterium]